MLHPNQGPAAGVGRVLDCQKGAKTKPKRTREKRMHVGGNLLVRTLVQPGRSAEEWIQAGENTT